MATYSGLSAQTEKCFEFPDLGSQKQKPCDPAWMLDSTAPDLLSALGTAAWNQA
jgi:hypothetical protein